MWELWRRAKTFCTTPSSLLGLRPGSVKAFYFDRGIYLWATEIENEMNAAEARAKNRKLAAGMRSRILENHLSKWETPEEKAKRFRDPAAPKAPTNPNEVPDGGEIVLGGDSFGGL